MSVGAVILSLVVSPLYARLLPGLQRLENCTKLCSYLLSVPLFLLAGEGGNASFSRVFILAQLLKFLLKRFRPDGGRRVALRFVFAPPTEPNWNKTEGSRVGATVARLTRKHQEAGSASELGHFPSRFHRQVALRRASRVSGSSSPVSTNQNLELLHRFLFVHDGLVSCAFFEI